MEHWKQHNGRLERTLIFSSQTRLAEFLLKVAKYSDETEHHAEMHVFDYCKLRLSICTHDANAITEKDRVWAKYVDGLFVDG